MPIDKYTLKAELTAYLSDEAVALLSAQQAYCKAYPDCAQAYLQDPIRTALARELGDKTAAFFDLLNAGGKLERSDLPQEKT